MTLAADITADPSIFFDSSEFAQAATYTPNGGAPVDITVIFDPENIGFDAYSEAPNNESATALCKTSDVPNAAHKDTLLTGGVTYEIRTVEVGQAGITTLTLNKL